MFYGGSWRIGDTNPISQLCLFRNPTSQCSNPIPFFVFWRFYPYPMTKYQSHWRESHFHRAKTSQSFRTLSSVPSHQLTKFIFIFNRCPPFSCLVYTGISSVTYLYRKWIHSHLNIGCSTWQYVFGSVRYSMIQLFLAYSCLKVFFVCSNKDVLCMSLFWLK